MSQNREFNYQFFNVNLEIIKTNVVPYCYNNKFVISFLPKHKKNPIDIEIGLKSQL